jgi:hypothetical protein
MPGSAGASASPKEYMATIQEAPGDLDALAQEIEAGRIVTEADRRSGGEFIRSRILDRTGRGVDANGEAFAPYSAGYAKRKEKARGRTDQVDLYGIDQHPHMLNAMLSRATPEGFAVGFWGEEAARAEWNNEGAGRVPERRFFAASEQDVSDVHEAIGTRITARLGRATSLSNLSAAVED